MAALTIFGLAVIVAATFLDVHMSAARRLEARADLVRAAEATLESVRGGILPLVSTEVDLGEQIPPKSSVTISTELLVTPKPIEGLYEVRVESRAVVRTEVMVVAITSQVWRP